MEQQGELAVAGQTERWPYARGGSRDIRGRAVAAVAQIETTVAGIEEWLVDVTLGIEFRRIGRLKLRYVRREGRFGWRRRRGPRDWEEVGARVPQEIKKGLRVETRAKVDTIDRWLDARSAGLAALRMIEWCAVSGAGWTEGTVTLRWKGSVPRRVTWLCLLGGGDLRRGGVLAEDGPPTEYGDDVKRFSHGQRHGGKGGVVTAAVEGVVARLEEIDEHLRRIKEAMRGVYRLYYNRRIDAWQMRHLTGGLFTRYIGQAIPEQELEHMNVGERQLGREMGKYLAERGRIKRALRVIGTLAETAGRWPGGVWQVRGERGGGRGAGWVAMVAETGVLLRAYDDGGQKIVLNGRVDREG